MDLRVNEITIYAEQAGTGPPLVFVHGMCGDARVWAGQVERLADRFECTTYDRRGHTRSSSNAVAETVELHADDLAALISTLEVASPIVVGSSGGARVTLDLIRRYPQLVRGAVLSEPPVGALSSEAFAAFISDVAPAVRQAAESGEPSAAVDAFFAAVCPGLWSTVDEPVKDRYRANAPALFTDLGMPAYDITTDDVARIEVPVLVVSGTQSHPALQAVAETLAGSLPDVRRTILDCGHVTYAEQPDDFATAVAAFAAELTAGARRATR